MKKQLQFEVGQKVCSIARWDYADFTNDLSLVVRDLADLVYGKIIKMLPKNKYSVLWDDNHINDHVYNYDPKTGEIVSETAKPTIIGGKFLFDIADMKSKKAKIDKEFKMIEKQVKAKLIEAAKIIKDANKIAKSSGMDNLAEMYNVIVPLWNALDASGWNSSSIDC